jgi:glutamate/tyrosine decarboxylase-like PLP-dependent enzyme
VASRRIAPDPAAVARLADLDVELPRTGLAAADVVRLLDEVGSPATVATNGPRYFGFVTGAVLPVAQAAAWLGSAWDQNAGLTVMSPVAARLNAVALRWITGLLGLPSGTAGSFVTGATMANATCLAAARDAVLTRQGWDAASQGLVGAPPVSVVVGAEVHTTVRKALGLIGLGRDRATVLPADHQAASRPVACPGSTHRPSCACRQGT